jgi:Flp pilus assembly protein protease CpaA
VRVVATDPVFGPVFLAGLAAASLSDLFRRRVPNPLNFAFAGVGLLGQAATAGVGGVGVGLLGLLVAFVCVIVPFALQIYRGGDAKLVLALGLWLGPTLVAVAFLAGAILGGALGLFMAWRDGHLSLSLSRVRAALTTRTAPVVDSDRLPSQHVPMAPAFAAGALLALYRAANPGFLF